MNVDVVTSAAGKKRKKEKLGGQQLLGDITNAETEEVAIEALRKAWRRWIAAPRKISYFGNYPFEYNVARIEPFLDEYDELREKFGRK